MGWSVFPDEGYEPSGDSREKIESQKLIDHAITESKIMLWKGRTD